MRVLPVLDPEVQVHAGRVGHGVEKLADELRVKIPHPGRCDQLLVFEHEIRPVAEVDGTGDERFIHRQDEEAIAADALLVSCCLTDCLAEDNTGVLHTVVSVDVQVSVCLH